VTLRSVLAVAGSVFERLVEAPSCCLLGSWTSRSSLAARCPWGDSPCARCANESPDDPSASSRQCVVAGAVQLASHTAESPWSGHFASSVPVRPQLAGRRLIACSPLEPTGGSEGVPPACVTAPPSSTTAQAYPQWAQEGRGERGGVVPGHRFERLHTHLYFNSSLPSLRGGLVGELLGIAGLGGAVRQPGCGLKPWRRRRQTQQRKKGCCGPRVLRRLSDFSAWSQVPPRLASCANKPGGDDSFPSQSSAQWSAAAVDATVGAEPLPPVSRYHPASLSSPLLGSMTVSPPTLSRRAIPSRRLGERPRSLQSILEGYKRSVVCLRAEDNLGPMRRSAPTREIPPCVTQAVRHRPPHIVDLTLTDRPGIR